MMAHITIKKKKIV